MSRAAAPPLPVSRPTLWDFFLLLGGCGLSHFLLCLGVMKVQPGPHAAEYPLEDLVVALPDLMRLPEGIILLWPLFFVSQRVLGRSQGLSTGEWLWVFAWLGTAFVTGLNAWNQLGTLPEFMQEQASWIPRIQRGWYVIFTPAMALMAVLIFVMDRIFRWPQPWTHTLSLVLVLWPVLPLVGILTLGKFVY